MTESLVFDFLKEAWQHTERLLSKVFHLVYQGCQQVAVECEYV